MVAVSFEVVKGVRNDAMPPVFCVRCMSENPSKSYDVKDRTLSLGLRLCASCDEKLFGLKRKLTPLLIASVVAFIGNAAWLFASPYSLEALVRTTILSFLLGGAFLVLYYLREWPASPTLPVYLEPQGTLAFENERFAAAFLSINAGKYDKVLTRAIRTRETAVNVTIGTVLVFACIQAIRLLWLQGGGKVTDPLGWGFALTVGVMGQEPLSHVVPVTCGIGLALAILELLFLLYARFLRGPLGPYDRPRLAFTTMWTLWLSIFMGIMVGAWDIPGALLGVMSIATCRFSMDVSEAPSRLLIPTSPS